MKAKFSIIGDIDGDFEDEQEVENWLTNNLTCSHEDVKISEEHKNYKWCSYEEAHKLIGFKNTRQVLKKANDYIMKEI